MSKAQHGFTLTEIIVAIAVIAILAGAMTPLVVKQIEKSRDSRASQDMRAIKAAMNQYFADTGSWPCAWTAGGNKDAHEDLRDYSCLYEDDGNTGWDGPYLEKSGGTKGGATVMAQKVDGNWQGIVDPWGNPYRVYMRRRAGNAPNGTIVLYSNGTDGRKDTTNGNLLTLNPRDDDILLLVTKVAGG